MAAAGAGEEAPVLTAFFLTLVSVLMWVLLRGLLAAWKTTLGAVLEGLAAALKYDAWKVHIDFGGPIRAVDQKVVNLLAAAALGYEHAIGFWWHQTARLQEWAADEIVGLSRDVLHWATWLQRSHLPNWIKASLYAALPPALIARLVHAAVDGELAHWLRALKAQARGATTVITQRVVIPHLGEWQWLHRHWKAVTAAVLAAGALVAAPPIALPRVWRGIDDLRRWRATVGKRLHRLEALFGAATFAALMANVLGLPSPRCLRSGPIGKVARRLCGLSATALADLLSLLADVVIVTEICEVLPYLEEGFNLIAGPLSDLIGEAGAALCGGDFDPPPLLAIPALSIPALIGATTVEV